jgi:hypothetical protein
MLGPNQTSKTSSLHLENMEGRAGRCSGNFPSGIEKISDQGVRDMWEGKGRDRSSKNRGWIKRLDTDCVCWPRRCMGFPMSEIANLISSSPKR